MELHYLKVNFESWVNWCLDINYLWCNLNFHGHEHRDFVLIQMEGNNIMFVQLLIIFRCIMYTKHHTVDSKLSYHTYIRITARWLGHSSTCPCSPIWCQDTPAWTAEKGLGPWVHQGLSLQTDRILLHFCWVHHQRCTCGKGLFKRSYQCGWLVSCWCHWFWHVSTSSKTYYFIVIQY